MSPSGDTDIEQWLANRLKEMQEFPAEGTAEALQLTRGQGPRTRLCSRRKALGWTWCTSLQMTETQLKLAY